MAALLLEVVPVGGALRLDKRCLRVRATDLPGIGWRVQPLYQSNHTPNHGATQRRQNTTQQNHETQRVSRPGRAPSFMRAVAELCYISTRPEYIARKYGLTG